MKHKGRGISCVAHPAGTRYGGGDPNQCIVKMKLDGSFELILGTVDIGQGSSMVYRQIAAELLGVGIDKIGMVTADTSAGTYCSGTNASRTMVSNGKAITNACRDLILNVQQFGAKVFDAPAEDVYMQDGYIGVNGDDAKKMSYGVFSKHIFDEAADFVLGHGSFMLRKFRPMPADGGFFEGSGQIAFGAIVLDVEVDDETGVVDVKKAFLAQDAGVPLNRTICEGQLEGGVIHSLGMALMENLYPAFPETSSMTKNFRDYIIPTASDIPELEYAFVDSCDPLGPFGAKGFSEMCTHFVACAIGDAIYDAVGVWMTSLPITPEKVLRALDDKKNNITKKYEGVLQ